MIATLHGRYRSSRLVRNPDLALLVVLGTIYAFKLVAIAAYVPSGQSIFQLGFSFDPYLRSLYEGKGFVGCEDFGCHRSSRMPAVPYFLYALTPLTLDLKVAAFIKATLLSILSFLVLRDFARRLTAETPLHFAFNGIVILFLVFAPSLIKHMTVLHYEEGYLIEIVTLTGISSMSVLMRGKDALTLRAALVPVLLAALAYLTKSSQILVLVMVIVIIVSAALHAGRRWAALVLLVVGLAAPALWTVHNLNAGNRFSLMSSYDGENMFRGWNANTIRVYPRCGLDILFTGINRCDGRPLDLPEEISRFGYVDEWAWNDAYKTRAMVWIASNPGDAVKTFGVKAATFLAMPRMVPFVLEQDGVEKWRKPHEEVLVGAWILVGRLLELTGLAMVVVLLRRGDGRARAIAAAALGLMACYAAPYIVGFGVERHFSVFIALGAALNLFLAREFVRVRSRVADAA